MKTWSDGTTLWWGTDTAADCTIVRDQGGANTRPRPSATHLRAPLTQTELDDLCAGAEVTLDNAALEVASGNWSTISSGALTIRGTGASLAIHYHAGNLGISAFTEGTGIFTIEGSTACNQVGAQWMGGFVAVDPEVDTTP